MSEAPAARARTNISSSVRARAAARWRRAWPKRAVPCCCSKPAAILASSPIRDCPKTTKFPAFHAFASENPAMRWDFFVRHYADEQRQLKDTKYRRAQGGVLYPRAGTLGGCTAHNAMILVYPHNPDWDDIAQLTGDSSWRADNMRRYFERLEDCRHRPLKRWIAGLTGFNPVAAWLRRLAHHRSGHADGILGQPPPAQSVGRVGAGRIGADRPSPETAAQFLQNPRRS